MKLLTKDSIFNRKPVFKIEEVQLGEDTIFLRELSAKQLDATQSAMMKEVKTSKGIDFVFDKENYRMKMVCACICDEKGTFLFDIKEHKQLAEIFTADELNKLYAVVEKLNKLSAQERDNEVKN